MTNRFLLLLTVLLTLYSVAQTGEVILKGSQTKSFTSNIVKGQEYVLQVSLPAGYENSNKNTRLFISWIRNGTFSY